MYKVLLLNLKNGHNFAQGALFDSQEDAQVWVDSVIDKEEGLMSERIVDIGADYEQDDILEVIETQEDTFDEEGNFLGSSLVQTGVRLKQQYSVEFVDASAEVALETLKSQRLFAGKLARETCNLVLDYIAGYNLEQNLSSEQITQMQTTFAGIHSALMASRPSLAKGLIAEVVVDGVIVTQALKDQCLEILSAY